MKEIPSDQTWNGAKDATLIVYLSINRNWHVLGLEDLAWIELKWKYTTSYYYYQLMCELTMNDELDIDWLGEYLY